MRDLVNLNLLHSFFNNDLNKMQKDVRVSAVSNTQTYV